MARVKQTARVSTTPPTPRTDGQLSMVERYPLDVPTDLVHCISGCEKERETRAPVPPALDKAPRKVLKVKASVHAKKEKKTKTE